MESHAPNKYSYLCTDKQQEQKELDDDDEESEEEILRRRISGHPLYGLLVETHLSCLKVASIGEVDRCYLAMDLKQKDNKISCLSTSELDRFMETYCFALRQLKEAMEESQLKSMSFINNMQSQLRELMATNATADTSSSGVRQIEDIN